jgi:hypothetical protein
LGREFRRSSGLRCFFGSNFGHAVVFQAGLNTLRGLGEGFLLWGRLLSGNKGLPDTPVAKRPDEDRSRDKQQHGCSDL